MSEIIVTSKEELKLLIQDSLQSLSLEPGPEDLRLRIDFLTTGQVAELANVNPNTVRLWSANGSLVPDREGRAEKYHIESVRAYLADRLQVSGVKTRERMLAKR